MSEDRTAAGIVQIRMTRYRNRSVSDADDDVCVEEPLEIMINDEPYYLTMRLPGEDMLLAVGFCFTEGVISSFKDVLSVNHCIDSTNRVNVYLTEGAPEQARKRRGIVNASCGICGKEIVSDICTAVVKSAHTVRLALSEVLAMQKSMESRQTIFPATGATHAAAIFDGRCGLLALSEDVGRHNALDKAIGRVLFTGKPGEAKTAVLSSRVSYEMIQKAARLGVEIVAGASAPTSLAIDLARELDMTLIGFLRPGRANVYTCPERITFD